MEPLGQRAPHDSQASSSCRRIERSTRVPAAVTAVYTWPRFLVALRCAAATLAAAGFVVAGLVVAGLAAAALVVAGLATAALTAGG
jgi:hypothetical protein